MEGVLTMKTKSRVFWITRIMEIVRDNILSLPSEKERIDTIRAIQGIKDYFERVEKGIQTLPADDERQKILDAVDTIIRSLKKAESDPIYSAVFQLPRKRQVGVRGKSSLEDEALVETKLKELRQLSTESILGKLLDENYITKPQLIVLARKLRIVTGPHMSRQEIADRVFKRGFANPRGYELLRGVSDQSDTDI